MIADYQHRQTGSVILSFLIFAVFILVLLGYFRDWHPIGIVVILALIICMGLFHSLRVEVNDSQIIVKFGVSLIVKRFYLNEIVHVSAVRNHWYYGWGIRKIPGGWLYNVSGFDAVELILKNGKKYRIGTDQPDKLKNNIKQKIKKAS